MSDNIACPQCGGDGINEKLCGLCAGMHPLTADYLKSVEDFADPSLTWQEVWRREWLKTAGLVNS